MKLAIIIGSTRPGRQSPKQAMWVANIAKDMSDTSVDTIDLIDYPMPFFNEPISPRYNPNRVIEPAVKKWLDAVKDFDAYVFVTPEYNHSVPGVLKNALDFLTNELAHKPSMVVSHGSVGGARAAMHLKEILSESKAVVIPSGVAFSGIADNIDENGNLGEPMKSNPYGPEVALKGALEDLKWYSDALAKARG